MENIFENILKLSNNFEKLALSKEAPHDAPFGEYAWAPHREGKVDEPDNEIEKQIYSQLKNTSLQLIVKAYRN